MRRERVPENMPGNLSQPRTFAYCGQATDQAFTIERLLVLVLELDFACLRAIPPG